MTVSERQMSVVLTRAVCAGGLWLTNFLRLMLYSAILWPGFALMAIFYFFSTRVKRNVWYGRQVCPRFQPHTMPTMTTRVSTSARRSCKILSLCVSTQVRIQSATKRQLSMQGRNVLDLYVPYRHQLKRGKAPVVVFVTGGAWIIGYKAWGALLGRRLSQRGVLVASLDYRNFPQVRVPVALATCGHGAPRCCVGGACLLLASTIGTSRRCINLLH